MLLRAAHKDLAYKQKVEIQIEGIEKLTSAPPLSLRAFDTRARPSAVALALAMMASASPEEEIRTKVQMEKRTQNMRNIINIIHISNH